MSEHVFGAYSLSPTEDGEGYTLKTAHLDKGSGEMVYDECYIDREEQNPVSGAIAGQLSARGEDFDVSRGDYKEAFETAVNSQEAYDFEAEHGVNREVFATMVVMEEHFDMPNSPEVVNALEARRDGLEAAEQLKGAEVMEQKEALCEAPANYEDRVVATIITNDSVHVLTEDGHLFDATDMAMDGAKGSSITHRQNAINEYTKSIGKEQQMFSAQTAGRNLEGAAMDHQASPETAGKAYDRSLHIDNAKEPLTQDLGMNFEMADDRSR